jgi:hypothetical protein
MPSFMRSPWIRGAPQGMRLGHSSDEGGDLRVPADGPPEAGLESVVQCSQKRRRCHRWTVGGGHDQEGLPPPGPAPRQPAPEEAISPAKRGPGRRSLVHGELLAQGEVLQSELAVAAAEEREESK